MNMSQNTDNKKPIGDLFSILVAHGRREITRSQAIAEVARFSTGRLQEHLETAGLTDTAFSEDRMLLADMLVALHNPPDTRSTETKTLRSLISGQVYEEDPDTLLGRYAMNSKEGMDIWALYGGSTTPKLVKEFSLSQEEIKGLTLKDYEYINEDLEPPIEPELPTPLPIEVGNPWHYRVDIKLVLWIPFHGNSLPIPTRFMPSGWENSPGLNQEMRTAGRFMLATGNTTPPDSFTRDSWNKFVASKEYRGFVCRELYICCPDEKEKLIIPHGQDAGYTPAPASADMTEDKLNKFHGENQNAGSVASDFLSGPNASALDFPAMLPGRFLAKQAQLGGRLIRQNPPPKNEAFSKGEMLCPPIVRTAECLSGSQDFWIRVGRDHNLLNFMLTNKLIKFQGGRLSFKLCCDGKLKINFNHSAIPSWKLYINNKMVKTYSMLDATWAEVEEAFFEPLSAEQFKKPIPEMESALEAALRKAVRSKKVKNWSQDFTLAKRENCPGQPLPEEWIVDPGF